MRSLLLSMAVIAVGCGSSGTAVLVTVDAPAPVAGVAQLNATASAGGQMKSFSVPLGSVTIPPAVSFTIDVPASVTGSFQVQVEALDAQGRSLGAGAGMVDLAPGQVRTITIHLGACIQSPDSCDDGNPCNGTEQCAPDARQTLACMPGTPLADGAPCGTGKICLQQACVTSVCGDGFVDMAAGERCDPPNGTTCDSACQIHGCGDGIRMGSEQCDDDNLTNLDGCDATCQFEQLQRVNNLTMNFSADAFCAKNALGGAVLSVAQTSIQNTVAAGVTSGATGIIFKTLGLADLTGMSGSFQLGVVSGAPVPGSGYSGNNDLDWWYTVDPTTVDGSRNPLAPMPASASTSGGMSTMTAGPGEFTVDFGFTSTTLLTMIHARIQATVGATSMPTASANGMTPGHLASENLDPALVSFASMTGGKLCGSVTALTLSSMPIPSNLVGSSICTQNFSSSNSVLDLYVSGCTAPIGGNVFNPTQPDDSQSGSTYTFTADASHKVNGCVKDGAAGTLTACLGDAAYSAYFGFTTDRVIVH